MGSEMQYILRNLALCVMTWKCENGNIILFKNQNVSNYFVPASKMVTIAVNNVVAWAV